MGYFRADLCPPVLLLDFLSVLSKICTDFRVPCEFWSTDWIVEVFLKSEPDFGCFDSFDYSPDRPVRDFPYALYALDDIFCIEYFET